MNDVQVTPSDFEKIKTFVADQGTDAALDYLEKVFSETEQFHQLFEVLKMKARRDNGLALLYDDNFTDLSAEQRQKFDDQLLDACATVGEKFFAKGDVSSGWFFMQPLADKQRVETLLRRLDVDEENVDEIVQVALGEAVAPEYGYQLVLEHFGTCNSITTYDSQISTLPQTVKTATAEMLVRHLYQELVHNICGHIEDQEGQKPASQSLSELIADRDWLFAGGGHHVDTTHLASVVRIARNVRDREVLGLAIELAEYGSRLDSQFHFQGDEPFEEIYPDHLRFFRGLLGEDTNAVEAWFLKKLAEMPPGMVRSVTVENLVGFLNQAGLNDRAIKVALQEINDEHQSMGIAPSVFELADNGERFERISIHYQNANDLLSFSIAEMLKKDLPR